MVLFMRILVCIKQVPDMENPILIDDRHAWIQSDEISEYRMNRLDEFALEEAVLIKEALSGTTVDAVSVGPDRSTEVIRRSIGMGADAGIHIATGSEGYHSSFEIAAWIAEYARGKPYDLILTGAMSEDNMQGHVGPMIAERLALPCATAVIFEKIASDYHLCRTGNRRRQPGYSGVSLACGIDDSIGYQHPALSVPLEPAAGQQAKTGKDPDLRSGSNRIPRKSRTDGLSSKSARRHGIKWH